MKADGSDKTLLTHTFHWSEGQPSWSEDGASRLPRARPRTRSSSTARPGRSTSPTAPPSRSPTMRTAASRPATSAPRAGRRAARLPRARVGSSRAPAATTSSALCAHCSPTAAKLGSCVASGDDAAPAWSPLDDRIRLRARRPAHAAPPGHGTGGRARRHRRLPHDDARRTARGWRVAYAGAPSRGRRRLRRRSSRPPTAARAAPAVFDHDRRAGDLHGRQRHRAPGRLPDASDPSLRYGADWEWAVRMTARRPPDDRGVAAVYRTDAERRLSEEDGAQAAYERLRRRSPAGARCACSASTRWLR